MSADLRTVPLPRFPFLFHHLTGSAGHNAALRGRARARGLKLNEYGLFREDGELVACRSEAELFEALGLRFIPPELREDLGELEAAETGTLPRLIEPADLRGVLHVHTTWSDGRASVEEMARACRDAGYEWMAVSDHSQAASYAGGLDPERVRRQHEEVDALDERMAPFRILKSIELDILKDGSLDFEREPGGDELLASFDLVIASVHSHFSMDTETVTARVERALRHPRVHVLGHPTGRLLLGREGYPVDMERVLRVAAEEDVIVELNASPHRLDLDWRLCRRAKELGVSIAIDPDAHRVGDLAYLSYGVGIARKGWLEASDVVSCLGADELLARVARTHQGRPGR